MRNVILIPTFFAFIFILGGCTPAEPPVNKANTNSANKPGNVAPANNPLATNKAPEAATTNNGATVAPVMAAYYTALKAKDDAGLKKLYTANALKNLEKDMKEDKKTSLSAFLSDYEILPETGYEVRNEKVEGDTAIAEIKGGSYGVWTKMKFAKEGGEWKMTGESPEFEAVNKTAANPNNGK